MNFLSHFYFDRSHSEPYRAMGTVLPDLLKNAAKGANIHPEKMPGRYTTESEIALLTGWNRHLAVDKYFHSSDFFTEKTGQLKALLKPITADGPVRLSFLAHIALELLLDHLLIAENMVSVQAFYKQLEQATGDPLDDFLEKSAFRETGAFRDFLKGFLSSRYLLSYQKIENITYALNRICMRLWIQPFAADKLPLLDQQLELYSGILRNDFLEIFTQTGLYLAQASPDKS
ncbi:hypothetical protein [Pedobacter sp. SYP-B3415]|uniref:ACP phosphodiesterase n=1 Tax=Pedobacter sp. SYP-B3415 TaxID=2496641 RepID=UPI00101C143D|nr:hypothetical protein [Pedobacter sp. SYP-B3415]